MLPSCAESMQPGLSKANAAQPAWSKPTEQAHSRLAAMGDTFGLQCLGSMLCCGGSALGAALIEPENSKVITSPQQKRSLSPKCSDWKHLLTFEILRISLCSILPNGHPTNSRPLGLPAPPLPPSTPEWHSESQKACVWVSHTALFTTGLDDSLLSAEVKWRGELS